MELATPAHGGYFREPASRVNKQLNQGTMMMDKVINKTTTKRLALWRLTSLSATHFKDSTTAATG